MRSPTLLTGVTGAVAVLVLVYVGLTAMNLQPHITFGDPPVRVAAVDQTHAKAELTPPPVAATPPNSPAEATATPASPAPTPPVPPAPAPSQQAAPARAGEPNPAAPQPDAATSGPGGAPNGAQAAAEPPPASASLPSPPPAAAPEASAPAVATSAPAAPVTVSSPAPETARSPAPESAPRAAEAGAPDSAVAVAPPVAPAPSASLADGGEPPAGLSATLPSGVASAPSQTADAQERALSERMAPSPSPLAPALPPVSSVPTPLARPKPPEAERLASAETRPPEDVAERDKAAKEASEKDKSIPSPSEPQPRPQQSAALAPQPEKADGGVAAGEQPNGGLKSVDLSRPFAERAGILTVGGRSVQLAGIVPTDPQRTCTGTDGKEWPCGTLARTALRSFLLGRTITCDVADPAWKGSITADCRFAKLSIADWLARNGWAEVESGSPLTAAADEARKAGRGVYGNDPRKKHQSTLAPEPPKEDPLNPI